MITGRDKQYCSVIPINTDNNEGDDDDNHDDDNNDENADPQQ
jgi:hypothetical protein